MSQELINMITSGGKKATFCVGLAWLIIMFPPNYEAWLNGELDGAVQGTSVAALGITLQGVIGTITKVITGSNPFKSKETKDEKVS